MAMPAAAGAGREGEEGGVDDGLGVGELVIVLLELLGVIGRSVAVQTTSAAVPVGSGGATPVVMRDPGLEALGSMDAVERCALANERRLMRTKVLGGQNCCRRVRDGIVSAPLASMERKPQERIS